MKAPDRQEALLIFRARQGDHRAFESLVSRHQRSVYSLALRMLGNADDAEDVLQETFLSLFVNLRKFRGKSSLSTYLYRTAANFSLMRLRKRKSSRERQHVELEHALEKPDPKAFSLDDLIESEKRGLLNRLLMELGQAERAAVVLGDIEGFSDQEAALMLGLTLPAFKSRLRRGRESLRKKLAPYMRHFETA